MRIQSKKKIYKPELICPAGDWCSLKTSVENGADSVYFGIQGLNMRNLAPNFKISEMKKIMHYLHGQGKKGYLALNVIVYNNELATVQKILRATKAASVDAVVLWDMAIFAMAKQLGLNVHLSTQASVSNQEAAAFYNRLGVQRIILARECSLADIRTTIRQLKTKGLSCELEVFIHGAMCVSISGRCLLSEYSFGKSANRGECLQPCRREFLIKETEGENEYLVGKDYILSPKDLCSINFLDKLIRAGIQSFKIEGRMRSPEYVSVVTAVYRQAIDAFAEGRLNARLKAQLKEKLLTVYTRGFSSGFFLGQPVAEWSRRLEHRKQKKFLGEVRNFYRDIGVAEIVVRSGTLKKGDELIFMAPDQAIRICVADSLEQNHQPVDAVSAGERCGVKLPFAVRARDQVYVWCQRSGRKG